MVNKALFDYFIEGKNKGFTTEQLKETLLKQGYSSEDIDIALIDSLKEKPGLFSSHFFKIALIIVLVLMIVVSFYLLLTKLDIFEERVISGVQESYVNRILNEECSSLKGQQYAECSTDAIVNIAFNHGNDKLCGFSKYESICIDKLKEKRVKSSG